MKRIGHKSYGFAVLVLVALFLYFGNGAMMGRGMEGDVNENSWMWFPTIGALVYGITLSWLYFKYK